MPNDGYKRVGVAFSKPHGPSGRRDEYGIYESSGRAYGMEVPKYLYTKYEGYRENTPKGEVQTGLALGGPGWREQSMLEFKPEHFGEVRFFESRSGDLRRGRTAKPKRASRKSGRSSRKGKRHGNTTGPGYTVFTRSKRDSSRVRRVESGLTYSQAVDLCYEKGNARGARAAAAKDVWYEFAADDWFDKAFGRRR